MLKLDDSIFEYALYDLLATLALRADDQVTLATLRDSWRTTGLRHDDLYVAIELLMIAESMVPVEQGCWQVTVAGASRLENVAALSSATMADEVARSVLRRVRDCMPVTARMPRSGSTRRHVARAHVRQTPQLNRV